MAVNLFAPNGGPFVGPLLVGVSKADLVAPGGAPKFPATQTLAGWPAEPLAFSLMPARTQARPTLLRPPVTLTPLHAVRVYYILYYACQGEFLLDDAERGLRARVPTTYRRMVMLLLQQCVSSHAVGFVQAGSAHDQAANGTLFVVGTAASQQAPATAARQLVSWAITNTQSLSGTVCDRRLTCCEFTSTCGDGIMFFAHSPLLSDVPMTHAWSIRAPCLSTTLLKGATCYCELHPCSYKFLLGA